MARRKKRSRQAFAVALAIIGVAGLSMASAAQLNVTSASLAAGVSVVAACDTDVAVSYGTSFSNGAYQISSVTISGINVTTAPTCVGKRLDFTLLDSSAAPITNGTGAVASVSTASHTVNLGTPVSAASVAQIAIVIR
jgi:hypothetical protein